MHIKYSNERLRHAVRVTTEPDLRYVTGGPRDNSPARSLSCPQGVQRRVRAACCAPIVVRSRRLDRITRGSRVIVLVSEAMLG